MSDLRQQPEKLVRRQRQHPEHQVRHHFRISLDPDMPAMYGVLQEALISRISIKLMLELNRRI